MKGKHICRRCWGMGAAGAGVGGGGERELLVFIREGNQINFLSLTGTLYSIF